jgi:DNA primase
LRELLAGRIVVPELRAGQPIWLIGRRPDELSQIKYLALPGERPVLGLDRARGRREVFLIEGVFDWLTAVSWGLPAFSPSGTALPANRLGWLACAEVVWGVLDADRGGREGSERFAAALGRRWRPLALPDGLDLNDLARQPGGRRRFFRLLARSRAALGGAAGPHQAAPVEGARTRR